MGQKTRAHGTSALDRINVSRLISYLRYQLSVMVKPYLFEPNDSQTRHEVKNSIDAMLSELVSQRALYDFLVVCDGTNNTPARIDRSELWVDIAIEPVKAVEFIYIPLRILNTGGIANIK
jgi:phage tail sheath protein FI